jgi:dTMP kinase
MSSSSESRYTSPRSSSGRLLSQKAKRFPKAGLLIAFEGIDGAGKTTQAQKLKDYLVRKGQDVVVFKEPTTSSTWGRKIASMGKTGRHLTAEEESKHFLEDRRYDVDKNIRPALQQGKIVIMDRYYYSSMAYQGAKGMKTSIIEKANSFAPKPDLVLLLNILPSTAKERIYRHRNGETNHFEERLGPVGRLFLKIAKSHPEIKIIDGEESSDTVERQIESLVDSLIVQYEE